MLLEHFDTKDFNVVREALGIDSWNYVGPKYIGPEIPKHEDNVGEDYWGTRFKPVKYGTGVYSEKCFYPLANTSTLEDLEKYRWPQPDWWDFSAIAPGLENLKDRVVLGGFYSLFEQFNALKPIQDCLVDMYVQPDFVREIFQRLHTYWMEYSRQIFEAGGGNIHLLFISDDVGMQDRMMMDPELWRQFFPPFYSEFIEMAHSYGVKVAYHSDGAIDDIIPDLIEVGADILEPIQHICPGMDRQHLKDAYGKDILFMGGVENQSILPFGTVKEVEEETRECMRILGKGGGYMISSCHNFQPVTPIENILAMYRVIREESDRYL